jgi:hypothetical protein
MAIKDGGPAFPLQHNMFRKYELNDGMSLRDYFAGQALGESLGVISALVCGYTESARDEAERIANAAYLVADAMLKAREAHE